MMSDSQASCSKHDSDRDYPERNWSIHQFVCLRLII
jgi:hypothetical protein